MSNRKNLHLFNVLSTNLTNLALTYLLDTLYNKKALILLKRHCLFNCFLG